MPMADPSGAGVTNTAPSMSVPQSFLLIPCEKPAIAQRSIIWSNGAIVHFGEGKLWCSTDEFARRLVDMKNGNSTTDPHIRDAVMVDSLETIFLIVEDYSGVFACRKGSTLCLPMTCGRLKSGIRTAQAMKTQGPRASCLYATEEYLLAGDQWGAVAVWDLNNGSISSPPAFTFGVHGKDGCLTIRCHEDIVITTGGDKKEITVVRLLENGLSNIVGRLLLDSNHHLSTAATIAARDGFDFLICAGTFEGDLVFWPKVAEKPEKLAAVYFNAHKEQSVAIVEQVSDGRIITCSGLGEVILLNVSPFLETMQIESFGSLTKPFMGLFKGYLISDEFTSILVDDLEAYFGKESSHEERPHVDKRVLDLNTAIEILLHSHATAVVATRRALNIPFSDTNTFGDNLIPVGPLRNQRPCCSATPENGPIWVKRKVRPPKLNEAKRKPLFQSKDTVMKANGELLSTISGLPVKPLPAFCSFRKDDELYLKERNGEVFCSVVAETH